MIDYELPIDNLNAHKTYEYVEVMDALKYIYEEIPFELDFPQGGCQQRSHLISMVLSHKFGIDHSKIWLFSPAALIDFDERSLFVDDNNGLTPGNIIYWNYHTAPAIKIKTGNNIYDYLIFDPALEKSKPLILKDWFDKIGNNEISKYTFLYPEKYFFNCKYNDYSQLTNIFDGTFFEYVNPAKDNLVLEKGLAVNDMAMIIYRKYIKNLIEEQQDSSIESQRLIDLKEIFGNATALDLLFAFNLSGNTDNTSYRYVLGNYGEIIKEAKQIFHDRLLFWTAFTNQLLSYQQIG